MFHTKKVGGFGVSEYAKTSTFLVWDSMFHTKKVGGFGVRKHAKTSTF